MLKALFVLVSIVIVAQPCMALSAVELDQKISSSQEAIQTAALTYTEEVTNNRPIDDNRFPKMLAINKVNAHKLNKVELFMDLKANKAKLLSTDMRDVNALLKQNNLTASDKPFVSQTRALLYENNNELLLFGLDSNSSPMLDLNEAPSPPEFAYGILSFGKLSPEFVSDKNGTVTITQLDSGIVRIEQASTSEDFKTIIECDPKIAYKCYNAQSFLNGKLIGETVASEYKCINGKYFPFIYQTRTFGIDGKILTEKKFTFEKVEFDKTYSANDFRLQIPDGTMFTDMVLNMTSEKLQSGGLMDIQDLLGQTASALATEEIAKFKTGENLGTKDANIIFIPSMKQAATKPQPFVFDLNSLSLTKTPSDLKIDSENMQNYLIGQSKGDIAWDGSLISVRKAKTFTVSQELKRPLNHTSNLWCDRYALPEKVNLPYSMLIITNEKTTYLVTIKKIESDGIWVVSKKLREEEILRYKTHDRETK